MTKTTWVQLTFILDILKLTSYTKKKNRTAIIKKLKKHFATHEIPNELVTDNGQPFNSAEFENFLRSSGTQHKTSSPGYPQSNGHVHVENAVKTGKNLIRKANESGAKYYLVLLTWRNTLTEGMTSSPVHAVNGRSVHANSAANC